MIFMRKVLLIILMMAVCAGATAQAQTERTTIAEQVNGDDGSSTGFVADVLTWYDAHMNYTTVGLLMALESSFIPFPSEVVVPPAVYVACNPESRSGMVVWIIVLIGTLGALVGAYINYFLSRWLGRPIVYAFAECRLGRLLGLSKEKVQRAETYFNDHGNLSTLVGRLISRMNLGMFTLFTFIGAGVWNTLLAVLGWLAYQAADPSVIVKYSHQLSIGIVVLLAVVVVIVVLRALRRRKAKNNKD